MPKEAVEVLEVLGDKVKIKFTKTKMCSCCKYTHFCSSRDEILLVDNPGFSLEPGDKAEVLIDEKKNILANILIFFIPIVVFIIGLLVFKIFGEFFSFLLASILVCVYYVIVKAILKKKGQEFNLTILKKL